VEQNRVSLGHLRVLFFCQSADGKDPIVSDTFKRIRNMSLDPRIGHVHVIAIKGQNVDLGPKVSLSVLGTEKTGRWLRLFRLYQQCILAFRKWNLNICYLYMTPTMAPLFWPFKLLGRAKIVLWFAHSIYRWKVRFAIRYVADLWLSVNKAQGNLPSAKLRLVGQGVDTETFFPLSSDIKYDLVTVGRITPLKKIDLIIEALSMLEQQLKQYLTLAICGDCYSPGDREYKQSLERRIEALGLKQRIFFLGSVNHDRLPKILSESRIFVFPIPGGVGKATMEAMACGLPVVLCEPTAVDFFGEYLGRYFLCEPKAEQICEKIYKLMAINSGEQLKLKVDILHLIESRSTMKAFTTRVVDQLEILVSQK